MDISKVDECIAVGNEIWKNFKTDLKKNTDNRVYREKQLSYFQSKYKDFSIKFPIQLRYMIMFSEYHPEAFKLYLKKLNTCYYKTKEEWCERQADYIKYLYMKLRRNYNSNQLSVVWNDTKKKLVKEFDDFETSYKEKEIQLEEEKKKISEARRQELKTFLLNKSKQEE